MIITEGGNVFKDTEGQSLTQRIRREDVVPTVKWLEGLTGLSLVDNMLGSTGRAETSGDLDLAVDVSKIDKDMFIELLIKKGVDRNDLRKSGDSVHYKTPINGDPSQGYVQTDFMFGEPSWQKFSMMGGEPGSDFKGKHRMLLMASIAKAQGMKWSYKHGLLNRETNEVIASDPKEIAQKLIGGTVADLASVESILNKIKHRPDYEQLIADAQEAFAADGLKLAESWSKPGTADWYRHWSNIL